MESRLAALISTNPESSGRTCAWWLGALLLGLFAAVLGGCRDAPRVAGVVHLDPRLGDGRSSAAVLAEQRQLFEEHIFRAPLEAASGAPVDPPAPFVAEGAVAQAQRGGIGLGRVTGEQSLGSFVRAAALDARDTDVIEVDVDARLPGRARIEWTRADDPGRGRLLEVNFDGAGPQTLVFALAAQDGWNGAIERLAVIPNATGAEPVAIGAVRLMRAAYSMGHSPLAQATGRGQAGYGLGDGGLVTLELETRRAWPSDMDVPLVARARAPAGAVLSFDVAFDASSREIETPLHIAIDGRRPKGAWKRLFVRTIVPAERPAETLWRPVHVPLGALAEGAVELRFVAHEGGDGNDLARVANDSVPQRVRVLFGRPLLVPQVAEERLPNLLLITLDTARKDAFTPWNPARRTPFLAALAERSLVFDSALATSNSTQPSHASMLTGMHPLEHGVVDNFALLAPENETLAELLRERGYLTAGAVSQQFLGSAAGFGQGFDQFLEAASDAWLDGSSTVRGVRRWLESWGAEAPRPWFLWMHLFDPHTPYTPTAPFLEHYLATHGVDLPRRASETPDMPVLDVLPPEMAFLRGVTNRAHAEFLYEVCAAYTDALSENLASTLSQLDQLGSTAIFVTADHGESLGERSNWFNHKGVFPEVIRIPLVVSWPGALPPARVATPVSLIDILPTFAAKLGLRPTAQLAGEDLFAIAARPTEKRRVWFEHAEGWQAGTFDGAEYFVDTLRNGLPFGLEVRVDADGRRVPSEQRLARGQRFLFNLERDPLGLDDQSAAQPERTEQLGELLERYRGSLEQRARLARDMNAADRQQMGQLGYGDGETVR